MPKSPLTFKFFSAVHSSICNASLYSRCISFSISQDNKCMMRLYNTELASLSLLLGGRGVQLARGDDTQYVHTYMAVGVWSTDVGISSLFVRLKILFLIIPNTADPPLPPRLASTIVQFLPPAPTWASLPTYLRDLFSDRHASSLSTLAVVQFDHHNLRPHTTWPNLTTPSLSLSFSLSLALQLIPRRLRARWLLLL